MAKKAAPGTTEQRAKKAEAATTARGASPALRLYRRTMERMFTRLTEHFAPGLDQAVDAYKDIVALSYLAWRVANQHVEVEDAVYRIIREAGFKGEYGSRLFVSYIMYHVVTRDEAYKASFRRIMINAFQRLDDLLLTGQWSLGDPPDLAEITAKLEQLGGVVGANEQWVAQRSQGVKQEYDEAVEQEAEALGVTPQQIRETRRARQRVRQEAMEASAAEQFFADMQGLGEQVEECDSDALYVTKGGVKVKVPAAVQRAIENSWRVLRRRFVNRDGTSRQRGSESSEEKPRSPSPPA
jgi:hypothetical protein